MGLPMALHVGQIWRRRQDVIFQSPEDVGRGRSQDVERGRELYLICAGHFLLVSGQLLSSSSNMYFLLSKTHFRFNFTSYDNFEYLLP